MIKTKNNDIKVAGTDLFADSESFLNELTDSEMVQVKGAMANTCDEPPPSNLSLLLCL